ncbi:MAG: L,D-transpeptidase, partial [Okeania sp.]|nr:L,D-transpeptidase [Okeania sp.]
MFYLNLSNLQRLILLSLGIVIFLNYTQQKVHGSTPIQNQPRISTNATDLIESEPQKKPKSIIRKKALNKLYIQPNEKTYLVI